MMLELLSPSKLISICVQFFFIFFFHNLIQQRKYILEFGCLRPFRDCVIHQNSFLISSNLSQHPAAISDMEDKENPLIMRYYRFMLRIRLYFQILGHPIKVESGIEKCHKIQVSLNSKQSLAKIKSIHLDFGSLVIISHIIYKELERNCINFVIFIALEKALRAHTLIDSHYSIGDAMASSVTLSTIGPILNCAIIRFLVVSLICVLEPDIFHWINFILFAFLRDLRFFEQRIPISCSIIFSMSLMLLLMLL